jgi:hypothetical protein
MMDVADEVVVWPMTGQEDQLKRLKNLLNEVPVFVDQVTMRKHRKRPTVACRTAAYSLTSRRMTSQAHSAAPRDACCGMGSTSQVCFNISTPPPPIIF